MPYLVFRWGRGALDMGYAMEIMSGLRPIVDRSLYRVGCKR